MTEFNVITLAIALLALGISGVNFWLTHLRKGQLLLTQPMMFFFGWDSKDDDDVAKVTFRAALFSTAAKGHFLENLYVVLKHPDGQSTLPFWGYDSGSGMVRGSGVHVPQSGVVAYHHFNPLGVDDILSFSPGEYQAEIWAKTFTSEGDKKIGTYALTLNAEDAVGLRHHEGGILWSWSPSDKSYRPEQSPRRLPSNENAE